MLARTEFLLAKPREMFLCHDKTTAVNNITVIFAFETLT